jgi:hypothetical protein
MHDQLEGVAAREPNGGRSDTSRVASRLTPSNSASATVIDERRAVADERRCATGRHGSCGVLQPRAMDR